jgi:crotonobetainyl-CoA:carnitine CoA-transferase CaiB-like acyl-CoA transferase
MRTAKGCFRVGTYWVHYQTRESFFGGTRVTVETEDRGPYSWQEKGAWTGYAAPRFWQRSLSTAFNCAIARAARLSEQAARRAARFEMEAEVARAVATELPDLLT